MSWGRGVFIGSSNQSETSRVATRVSLRMAPDACVVAPRAPHVWLHDQDVMPDDTTPSTCLIHSLVACKSTPQLTHVAQHASIADSATPRASIARHLVLLCVTPHVVIIWASTPRASLASYPARQLTPRPTHV
ncbi:hypothetical protein Bca101_059136 [Brassica carinata]